MSRLIIGRKGQDSLHSLVSIAHCISSVFIVLFLYPGF